MRCKVQFNGVNVDADIRSYNNDGTVTIEYDAGVMGTIDVGFVSVYKCTVVHSNVTKNYEATFIQFGHESDDEGDYDTALVKDCNGRVRVVPADQIKFKG